jgi:hypothetical protein
MSQPESGGYGRLSTMGGMDDRRLGAAVRARRFSRASAREGGYISPSKGSCGMRSGLSFR